MAGPKLTLGVRDRCPTDLVGTSQGKRLMPDPMLKVGRFACPYIGEGADAPGRTRRCDGPWEAATRSGLSQVAMR